MSSEAVLYANARNVKKVNFIVADIETYWPKHGYDLILFEETLYYVKAFVRREVFKRYVEALNQDGGCHCHSCRSVQILENAKHVAQR